jgi:hypothetical protein
MAGFVEANFVEARHDIVAHDPRYRRAQQDKSA